MRVNKVFMGLAIWIGLLSSFLSAVVLAVDLPAYARVNIVEAINIQEISEVDFGNVLQQDGVCTMLADGNLTGTGDQQCQGQEVPAHFMITGTVGQSVVVSVAQGDAVDGVSFAPVVEGGSSRVLADGNVSVIVVGALSLQGASVGEKNLSYTLTANYQ